MNKKLTKANKKLTAPQTTTTYLYKDKKIDIDWEDEILKKSCVSYDGKVLNI